MLLLSGADLCQNMKRVGNTANNKLYNPKNVHPAIPIDVDEVDGAMERFIRQKYERREYQEGGSNRSNATSPGSRHNTGSTSSDDRPPALPPKPNKRFFFPSLRSASSTVPRQGTLSPPTSPGHDMYGEPSPKENKKHSKFLGASVASSRDDALERKIQYLKDMGFLDEKKNAQVLKGLNGNVDKAVETLIRLGEGTNHNQEARNQFSQGDSAKNQLPTPRATPVNGITVEKNRQSPIPTQNNNPFDRPGDTNKSLPPPPSSSTDRSVSPPQAYNPFAQPAQQFAQSQQPSIDQAFSNMSLNQQPTGQQAAQLFPNTTGGYGGQPQAGYNPFMQQTAAPPVPQIPQQYSQFTPPTSTNPPQQAFPQQPQPQPQASYTDPTPNPFLRTSRSQNFNPSNPFDTQGPFNAYSTASPFGIQPQHTSAQPASSFGIQPQQTGFAAQPTQTHNNSYNPFQASNLPAQSVFGAGISASPAGTPFGQPGGMQAGNSYPFTQTASSPPPFAQAGGASSPFGQPSASSPFAQPQGNSPFVPQQQGASSPFGQPNGNSPFGPAGPVQQQPGYQQSATDMQFQPPQAPFSQPSFQSPSSAPPQQQSMFQPPQQLVSQIPSNSPFSPRHDKTSILALYNMPQPAAPQPMQQPYTNGGQTVVQDFATQQPNVPQRSVTMPVPTQHASPPNPFASLAGMAKPNGIQNNSAFASLNGPSRESVDFAGLAMMSGRHSPDAFSGLSARMR